VNFETSLQNSWRERRLHISGECGLIEIDDNDFIIMGKYIC
jgi:hypothetical protein